MSELPFTEGPWHVDADPDQYGSYCIAEAATEQDDWVIEGCAISDEEGDRRNAIAKEHEIGNARLIESSPAMYEICRLLAERDQDDPLVQDAIAVLDKIEGGAE